MLKRLLVGYDDVEVGGEANRIGKCKHTLDLGLPPTYISLSGIGMDSAVIPLPRHGLSLVQSVDFFYPLVDDPFTMGAIAFSNMSSDIFATGVTKLDKVTLILSSPHEFSDKQRDIVIPMMIKGFSEAAKSTGNNVRVGNIASNPWCVVGGVATSICTKEEIIL